MIDQELDERHHIRGHGPKAWRFSVDPSTAPKVSSSDLRILLLKSDVPVNPNEVGDLFFRIGERQPAQDVADRVGQMFPEAGVRKRFFDIAGSSLVSKAGEAANLPVLKYFVSQGCPVAPGLTWEAIDLDERPSDTFKGREYPIHKFAEYGLNEGIEWIVQTSGIEHLHLPSRGFTALHCAAQHDQVPTALAILELDPSTYFDRGPGGKSFQELCEGMGKAHVWRAAAAWRNAISAREVLDEINLTTIGARP